MLTLFSLVNFRRSQDESMSFTQMMRNIEDDEEPELSGRERVTIRRDSLYLDSKRRLNVLGKRLRKRIQVTFVNKLGQQEAGIGESYALQPSHWQ